MKRYQHIAIIAILVLLTVLFYKKGFGYVPFLLSSVYLGAFFIKEVNRHE